jgi:hypothetical protein
MPQFEEGYYRVRIVNQCFTESQLKGTLGFILSFRVLSNLDRPDAPISSYQRDATLWVTDKTYERTLQQLHNLVKTVLYAGISRNDSAIE